MTLAYNNSVKQQQQQQQNIEINMFLSVGWKKKHSFEFFIKCINRKQKKNSII